jgi:hypothetical protein
MMINALEARYVTCRSAHGEPKRSYMTLRDAEMAIKKMCAKGESRANFDVIKCDHHGYHVGHNGYKGPRAKS